MEVLGDQDEVSSSATGPGLVTARLLDCLTKALQDLLATKVLGDQDEVSSCVTGPGFEC